MEDKLLNNLQIFKNPEFGEVRVLEKDGQPWFVAKNVCECLEIKNNRDAISRLDEDEKGVVSTDTLGGNQDMLAVNEYGLYNLVLSSRKSSAKKFKRWVTHEILPSIRKNGGYIANQENLSSEQILANAVLVAQNVIAERDKLITEMKPKAIFADAVSTSKNCILIGDLAKLIKQNGVDIGQKRLFEWLRANGYLIKRKGFEYNSPTQNSMDLGLFEVKETAITHSDGHTSISKTTKVTGKGQQYFINKFLK